MGRVSHGRLGRRLQRQAQRCALALGLDFARQASGQACGRARGLGDQQFTAGGGIAQAFGGVHRVANEVVGTGAFATDQPLDHRALVRAVEAFARPWTLRHQLSWLWVRFEPARAGEAPAPQIGWCRWWVEVWTQGQRYTVELGWGHPHCTRLALGPGLAELTRLRGPE